MIWGGCVCEFQTHSKKVNLVLQAPVCFRVCLYMFMTNNKTCFSRIKFVLCLYVPLDHHHWVHLINHHWVQRSEKRKQRLLLLFFFVLVLNDPVISQKEMKILI